MQDAGFVRQAFARISRRYVLANHVLSLGIDILWRKRTARLVAGFKPKWVLDLATGSGDLAVAVKEACPEAHILGADFSVPMMREAQARHWGPLVAADGMNLPFKDESFDVVTVAFGLRNMASWPDALREMRRVLRPAGKLVVLDFSLPVHFPVRPAYLFYLKHLMPRMAGWITGQRNAYEYLCSSVERFPSGKEMEKLIDSCGFNQVRTKRLSTGIASLYVAWTEEAG
jgi:demethylmenaquinone methyltransferase/2-methoxy-6-polyprenyl-1,4-benzoquinol methylase